MNDKPDFFTNLLRVIVGAIVFGLAAGAIGLPEIVGVIVGAIIGKIFGLLPIAAIGGTILIGSFFVMMGGSLITTIIILAIIGGIILFVGSKIKKGFKTDTPHDIEEFYNDLDNEDMGQEEGTSSYIIPQGQPSNKNNKNRNCFNCANIGEQCQEYNTYKESPFHIEDGFRQLANDCRKFRKK